VPTYRELTGSDVKIWRPAGATHLRVEIVDDRVVLSARIRRLFPLSYPDKHFSIQDREGTEIGVLASLDNLDRESRKVLDEDLDRRYFTPILQSLDQVESQRGMWRFAGQTQRGPVEFWVRNWRDSSHELSPNRWQILSVEGQRYEIENLEALDDRSQRLLEQLL
jgi:hypothetical protein